MDGASSSSALRWEVLRSLLPLRALSGAWAALIRPGQESLGPTFVLAWFETMGATVTPLVLVARSEDRTLVGLLAMAEFPGGRLVFAASMEGGQHGDVVALPENGDHVARGALGALRSYAWKHISFQRLAANGHLARSLVAEGRLGPTRAFMSAAVPRIERMTTWSAFLKSRTKKVRHEIRRHIRRWEETPGAAIRWSDGRHALDEDIDTLFKLHERRFRSRQKRTQFTGFYQRVFHKRVARRLAREGRLLLVFLEIHGRPVAAAYGWHGGNTTTLYQTGFDPSAAKLSPGYLVAIFALRDAVIGGGRSVLDLGEGCYEWKLRWSNSSEHLMDVVVHRRGVMGRLRNAATSTLAAIRAYLRRHVRKIDCHGAVNPRGSKKHCSSIQCSACPARNVGSHGRPRRKSK